MILGIEFLSWKSGKHHGIQQSVEKIREFYSPSSFKIETFFCVSLQCKVSVKRLTQYLQADELDENCVNFSSDSDRK